MAQPVYPVQWAMRSMQSTLRASNIFIAIRQRMIARREGRIAPQLDQKLSQIIRMTLPSAQRVSHQNPVQAKLRCTVAKRRESQMQTTDHCLSVRRIKNVKLKMSLRAVSVQTVQMRSMVHNCILLQQVQIPLAIASQTLLAAVPRLILDQEKLFHRVTNYIIPTGRRLQQITWAMHSMQSIPRALSIFITTPPMTIAKLSGKTASLSAQKPSLKMMAISPSALTPRPILPSLRRTQPYTAKHTLSPATTPKALSASPNPAVNGLSRMSPLADSPVPALMPSMALNSTPPIRPLTPSLMVPFNMIIRTMALPTILP